MRSDRPNRGALPGRWASGSVGNPTSAAPALRNFSQSKFVHHNATNKFTAMPRTDRSTAFEIPKTQTRKGGGRMAQ